jgi:hypothetical protein
VGIEAVRLYAPQTLLSLLCTTCASAKRLCDQHSMLKSSKGDTMKLNADDAEYKKTSSYLQFELIQGSVVDLHQQENENHIVRQ